MPGNDDLSSSGPGQSHDSQNSPSPLPLAAVLSAVLLTALALTAGTLLSPLANPPVETGPRPRYALRVFPSDEPCNILILPFFDPESGSAASGADSGATAKTSPDVRVEERIWRGLMDSPPGRAGRLDAEFMLPERIPSNLAEARDLGARRSADLVVWGQGGQALVAPVSDGSPQGARSATGLVWTAPAVLPAEVGRVESYAVSMEALLDGRFEDCSRLFDQARAGFARFPEARASIDFHAASCAFGAGRETRGVKLLASVLSTPSADPDILRAARHNLDLYLSGHFKGFSEDVLGNANNRATAPWPGPVVPDSALDIVLENNFQGYQEACKQYLRILSLGMSPATSRLALAEVLETLFGDLDRALVEYEQTLRLDPKSFEAAYGSARIWERRPSGARKAVEFYRKGLAIRFDRHAAHNLAALLENRHHDWKSAADLYAQVLEADPEFFPSLHNLAVVLHRRLNRPEEARKLYERALAIDPDNVLAHTDLAMLCMERFKDWECAREHLQEAVRLAPGQAGPKFYLALLLRDRFQAPGLARTRYLEAARLNPALANPALDKSFLVRAPDAGSDTAFTTSLGRAIEF